MLGKLSARGRGTLGLSAGGLHFQDLTDTNRWIQVKRHPSHPWWPSVAVESDDANPPLVEYFTYNPIGFMIDNRKKAHQKRIWEFKGPNPQGPKPADVGRYDGYAEDWFPPTLSTW